MTRFDHSKDDLDEALGIPKDRGLQLFRKLIDIINRCNKPSEAMEAIYKDDSMTTIEKMFLAFILGEMIQSSKCPVPGVNALSN